MIGRFPEPSLDPPSYDYEPPVYRCEACGRFLCNEPTYEFEAWPISLCDGKPIHYTHPYDERLVAILGEEFRGGTYRVAFPAACGTKDGTIFPSHDGDVDPDRAAEWQHEPHWIVDEFGTAPVAVRVCWCGHENQERQL